MLAMRLALVQPGSPVADAKPADIELRDAGCVQAGRECCRWECRDRYSRSMPYVFAVSTTLKRLNPNLSLVHHRRGDGAVPPEHGVLIEGVRIRSAHHDTCCPEKGS